MVMVNCQLPTDMSTITLVFEADSTNPSLAIKQFLITGKSEAIVVEEVYFAVGLIGPLRQLGLGSLPLASNSLGTMYTLNAV